MDMKPSLSGGQLTSNLHLKPIDKYQYLHYASAPPDHTKNCIVFSQALRFNRICAYNTDFERHMTI